MEQFWIALKHRALWQIYCASALSIYDHEEQSEHYRSMFVQQLADGMKIDPDGNASPWWVDDGLSLDSDGVFH